MDPPNSCSGLENSVMIFRPAAGSSAPPASVISSSRLSTPRPSLVGWIWTDFTCNTPRTAAAKRSLFAMIMPAI